MAQFFYEAQKKFVSYVQELQMKLKNTLTEDQKTVKLDKVEKNISANNAYNEQEKSLLKRFIDLHLLPEPENNYTYFKNNQGIELILRTACDQKCEYCYLQRYLHDLYPQQIKREEREKDKELEL